jgi:hypothetical protein
VTLVAPPSPLGYPAPFAVLEALKVLGFTLHVGPMNLWYAGMPVAVVLALLPFPHGRLLAHRIARVMPVAVALGVNFGIIPLLFTQVVNHQFFYPTGVLVAWPWFAVIPLLGLAYYGIYVQAESRRRLFVTGAALISAAFLVAIGFFFSNYFSLMVVPERWHDIFRHTAVAGAPTGLALNVHDPRMWPRWLMMFGIALTTTAIYIALDTAYFAPGDQQAYRDWAGRFAFALGTLGLIWFAGMGSWYVFGTFSPELKRAILARPPVIALLAVTGVSFGLPWLLVALWQRLRRPLLAALAGAAQFGAIGINAVSRQWVQNVELSRYTDLAARPVHFQWGGFIAFVIFLLLGFAVCGWLVLRLHRAWRAASPDAVRGA